MATWELVEYLSPATLEIVEGNGSFDQDEDIVIRPNAGAVGIAFRKPMVDYQWIDILLQNTTSGNITFSVFGLTEIRGSEQVVAATFESVTFRAGQIKNIRIPYMGELEGIGFIDFEGNVKSIQIAQRPFNIIKVVNEDVVSIDAGTFAGWTADHVNGIFTKTIFPTELHEVSFTALLNNLDVPGYAYLDIKLSAAVAFVGFLVEGHYIHANSAEFQYYFTKDTVFPLSVSILANSADICEVTLELKFAQFQAPVSAFGSSSVVLDTAGLLGQQGIGGPGVGIGTGLIGGIAGCVLFVGLAREIAQNTDFTWNDVAEQLNVPNIAISSLAGGGTQPISVDNAGKIIVGGGGGGVSIGVPVGGADPNVVLFVDAGGNLAQVANFTFDGTALTIPSLAGEAGDVPFVDVNGKLQRQAGFFYAPDAGLEYPSSTEYVELYITPATNSRSVWCYIDGVDEMGMLIFHDSGRYGWQGDESTPELWFSIANNTMWGSAVPTDYLAFPIGRLHVYGGTDSNHVYIESTVDRQTISIRNVDGGAQDLFIGYDSTTGIGLPNVWHMATPAGQILGWDYDLTHIRLGDYNANCHLLLRRPSPGAIQAYFEGGNPGGVNPVIGAEFFVSCSTTETSIFSGSTEMYLLFAGLGDDVSFGLVSGAWGIFANTERYLWLDIANKNVALGATASINTAGHQSVAMGHGALTTHTNGGDDNTAIGDFALWQSNSYKNTGVGSAVGENVSTGHENTLVGYKAGENLTTGSHNTMVGTLATGAFNADYQIAIGDGVVCTATGEIRIGDLAPGTLNTETYIPGNKHFGPFYIEGFEMSAPAAPAADGFRVYAEDNGAGKTRLMVKFNTGAAQQVAIQP